MTHKKDGNMPSNVFCVQRLMYFFVCELVILKKNTTFSFMCSKLASLADPGICDVRSVRYIDFTLTYTGMCQFVFRYEKVVTGYHEVIAIQVYVYYG